MTFPGILSGQTSSLLALTAFPLRWSHWLFSHLWCLTLHFCCWPECIHCLAKKELSLLLFLLHSVCLYKLHALWKCGHGGRLRPQRSWIIKWGRQIADSLQKVSHQCDLKMNKMSMEDAITVLFTQACSTIIEVINVRIWNDLNKISLCVNTYV